ncbi:transcriptional regulatory protein QseB [Striga asiatica]|uniref:Transcriptional regulatory protein QseB n=1 Tax=Striga asiatica TaxID=4170 RepID=A0A5A7PDJ6_STRAF|nr:transcriptional regulatory protein QseB [Striga asiatica]
MFVAHQNTLPSHEGRKRDNSEALKGSNREALEGSNRDALAADAEGTEIGHETAICTSFQTCFSNAETDKRNSQKGNWKQKQTPEPYPQSQSIQRQHVALAIKQKKDDSKVLSKKQTQNQINFKEFQNRDDQMALPKQVSSDHPKYQNNKNHTIHRYSYLNFHTLPKTCNAYSHETSSQALCIMSSSTNGLKDQILQYVSSSPDNKDS